MQCIEIDPQNRYDPIDLGKINGDMLLIRDHQWSAVTTKICVICLTGGDFFYLIYSKAKFLDHAVIILRYQNNIHFLFHDLHAS